MEKSEGSAEPSKRRRSRYAASGAPVRLPAPETEFDVDSLDAPEGMDVDGDAPVVRPSWSPKHVRGAKGIPWPMVKRVFVETTMTQTDLAEVVGCTVANFNRKVMDGGWHALRAKHRASLGGSEEHRKELRAALERSQRTQETGAQLALASLTIIAENLKEWHERKRAHTEKHPGERFPERMPLTPAGVNALTTCMQRLEQWDRAKLGGPDSRIEVDVKTVDLTALLDKANVVG
jgi:hypothetical protein